MNREIKFRALELDTGRWVYGYYVAEHGYYMNNGVPDLNKPVVRHYIIGDSGRHDICEETVCQFTGLKDKAGTDIYERDIVDCYWLAELGFCEIDCQHKGVVRFVDCRFEVSFSDKAFIRNIGEDGVYSATELEPTCMSHDDDYAVEYEVVGNIYENPELINP